MWGDRVIVPLSLREETLRKLHELHIGVCRTQALARLYVWFPGITARIENTVSHFMVVFVKNRGKVLQRSLLGLGAFNANGEGYTLTLRALCWADIWLSW